MKIWSWEQAHYKVSIGSYEISVERLGNLDVNCIYSASVQITSYKCNRFVREIKKEYEKFCSFPNIRNDGKVETFLVGGAEKMIVCSDVEVPGDIWRDCDVGEYVDGARFPDLGFGYVTEKSFFKFINYLISVFSTSDLISVYNVGGVMLHSISGMDSFYACLFGCFENGYDSTQCIDVIKNSGLHEKYPKLRNQNGFVSYADMEIAESIYRRIQLIESGNK